MVTPASDYASQKPGLPSDPTPDPFSDLSEQDIELASRLGPANDSSDDQNDPPSYDASTSFSATLQLQIQTPGKPFISLPLPPKLEPIPVYRVTPDGSLSGTLYKSLRHSRRSGSSFLVSSDDDDASRAKNLSATTYRFGPGKPPRVRLFVPGGVETHGEEQLALDETEDSGSAATTWDEFEIVSKGTFTRAQSFKSRLGNFEWRYASRKERKCLPGNPHNVLVLERIVRVFRNQQQQRDEGAAEEVRTLVARLVRSEELRSPGSAASTAGNGGRLYIDLRVWPEEEKQEREMAQLLVVTTCLVMLKKEVDRRRAQQIAIMAAAAGGAGN